MAHFAEIEKNVVTRVIVISNDDCGGGTFPESEPIGQAFIADVLLLNGTWLQTSYSGSFRGCFAGIGYTYNKRKDIFVEPTPDPTSIEG